jgi:hypothetical protein
MSEFKIRDFLDRLDGLGLKLSATRMADGSVRLNQWRFLNYYENEAEIQSLWSRSIAGAETRLQDVARYVEMTQTRSRAALS